MTELRIAERVQAPWAAREKRLMCPHCSGAVHVPIPWDATAEVTHRLMAGAVEEHRRLCPVASSDAGIVYSVSYPRA